MAKLDSNETAMWAMRNNSYATMIDSGEIYLYEGGIYRKFGAEQIGEIVEKRTCGDLVTNRFVNEVVGHIGRHTYVTRDAFDADPTIINMDNGLYSTTTGLSPHTETYRSLHKSPIIYDPDAECPAIDQFIEDVVEPKRRRTIYEIVGYAFKSHKNMKTAFFFEGEKNSGKSVMLALIGAMVGEEATTYVSPLTVSRSTYGAAEYFGKQLNIVDDLGNSPIEETGVLKSIISSRRINAQFKYGQPFDYTPSVLSIFATNEVPQTTLFDEAFASRFNIIRYPNIFEGSNDDPNLLSKLTTPTELSGFFNKCMTALADVIEKETFTGDSTLADRVKQFVYSSNPVARFVDERCVTVDSEDYITKDTLYRAYVLWARENGTQVVEMASLTKHLKRIGCGIRQIRNDDGGRSRAYVGVTLRTFFEEL